MLGDNDPEGMFLYADAALDSAVKTVFRMGRSPAGFSVSGESVTPDVPDGTSFAKIACETALMLVCGEETISYSTRAMSVRRNGDRIRNLVTELRCRLSEGDTFESYQTFVAWIQSYTGIGELTQIHVAAPMFDVSLNGSGSSPAISV
jgi:hypothetical protein